MWDHVQPPAATLDDGLDPPAPQRPHPRPHPLLNDSRSFQILCEFSELALPPLHVAVTRPQLGSQRRKAGLDDKQPCALSVRLERELDAGHLCVALVRLPSKGEALRWLDGLDHAAAAATWASGPVPGKENLSARTQIDAGLRAEPGSKL